MRQHALIGAIVFAGAGAQAAPVPLSEDELKAAVAGKTVAIETPLGLPISVNYGANGIMTGTAGTALAVYLGAPKDRGRWSIRNGKLCQKWFKWLGGDTTCLAIRQEGQKIFWRSDEGRTGTAMIEAGPPVIEGASASGLGLPPQPSGVEQALAGERQATAPELPPLPQQHAPVRPAPGASRAEPPRHARAHPVPSSAVMQASFAREAPHSRETTTAEPVLAEAPQPVARPAPTPVEPWATRFALASFAPTRPLPQPARAVVAPLALPADPFDADREPMRRAADLAAIGVLEHRWCLANAFAKGPALPFHLSSEGLDPAPELVNAPSLLSIAQEQAYAGELPLHEAACVTEEPAIGVVAKRAGP